MRLKQAGLTLIELVIAIFIGLVLTTGLLLVFLATLEGNKDNLSTMQLNQDLRSLMFVMVSDIRRAGFDGDPDLESTFNPFTTTTNNINIGAASGEAASSCITYSYDFEMDEDNDGQREGLVGVCDSCNISNTQFNDAGTYTNGSMEMFGFRLRNNAVEMRLGMANEASSSENFDCNDGNWQAVTDNDLLTVTQLTFNLTTKLPTDAIVAADNDNICVVARTISIGLAGQLANDATIRLGLDERVKVRNNRIYKLASPATCP